MCELAWLSRSAQNRDFEGFLPRALPKRSLALIPIVKGLILANPAYQTGPLDNYFMSSCENMIRRHPKNEWVLYVQIKTNNHLGKMWFLILQELHIIF